MRNTIKKHQNFLSSKKDIEARCATFFIRARPAHFPEDPQYGLITTKKTFKLAVDRNRAKRLLRDWIRFNEKYMLDDLDYIFIARHTILNENRTNGRDTMRKALNFIKKSYAEKNVYSDDKKNSN